MNLYAIAVRMRRQWPLTLACTVLAVVVAIVVAYQVSLSPPSLRPRALQLGIGGVQLLVDSGDSSVANLHSDPQRFTSLGATFSQLVDSPRVLVPVGRALKVSPSEIGVTEQVVTQVALSQSQPLKPQVGADLLASRKHYSILARNNDGPVIQIFTQAPTAAQARTMATAVGDALSSYTAANARAGHIPHSSAVVIRRLGDPVAHTLDHGATLKAAVLVGLLVWVLALVAVFTIQTQVWRARAAAPRTDGAEPAEA